MDTNIIVTFHPFDISQDIAIYQKGECIKQIQTTLDNITGTLYKLEQQYNINRINMCGNPSFVNKYIRELKTKFSYIPKIEIIAH